MRHKVSFFNSFYFIAIVIHLNAEKMKQGCYEKKQLTWMQEEKNNVPGNILCGISEKPNVSDVSATVVVGCKICSLRS